ncbi:unnamed protein product [Toxocara canis]|uniref:Uncharacterized protein n=1 Tax=Toxocara canis TaxID=6265 RepID=A0A183V9V7_TOXCA|nr:unnamed protein product [Toxocara canis]
MLKSRSKRNPASGKEKEATRVFFRGAPPMSIHLITTTINRSILLKTPETIPTWDVLHGDAWYRMMSVTHQ